MIYIVYARSAGLSSPHPQIPRRLRSGEGVSGPLRHRTLDLPLSACAFFYIFLLISFSTFCILPSLILPSFPFVPFKSIGLSIVCLALLFDHVLLAPTETGDTPSAGLHLPHYLQYQEATFHNTCRPTWIASIHKRDFSQEFSDTARKSLHLKQLPMKRWQNQDQLKSSRDCPMASVITSLRWLASSLARSYFCTFSTIKLPSESCLWTCGTDLHHSFLAFAGTQVANSPQTTSGNTNTSISMGANPNQLMYIALSFGFSLAVMAWIFFRISGGLFNPAVRTSIILLKGHPSDQVSGYSRSLPYRCRTFPSGWPRFYRANAWRHGCCRSREGPVSWHS